jgi:hypothetical protein
MVNYYVMYGPDLDTVVGGYRQATGAAPMFPQWAYGLFQSYDHYNTQAEAKATADGYRNNNIPVDVVVQNWQYWNPNPGARTSWMPAGSPTPRAGRLPAWPKHPFDDLRVARFDPARRTTTSSTRRAAATATHATARRTTTSTTPTRRTAARSAGRRSSSSCSRTTAGTRSGWTPASGRRRRAPARS